MFRNFRVRISLQPTPCKVTHVNQIEAVQMKMLHPKICVSSQTVAVGITIL